MNSKAFLFVLIMSGAVAASADVVGWWRFDSLGTEGGKTAASTVFTNLVDSTKYAAQPVTFNGFDIGSDETYLPSLAPLASVSAVGSVTSTLRVYDPGAETAHELSTVLSCPYGGNGTKLSGGARIPSSAVDARLNGNGEGQTGSFTFECFFKVDSITRTANMVAIAGQKAGDGMGCWSLMIYNKRLWGRFALKDKDTGKVVYTQQQIGGGGALTDVSTGVWHHAAFVFDAAAAKVKIYLDYALEATKTYAGQENQLRLAPNAVTEPVYFGKSMSINDDRVLDGELAEARISDAALAPDLFLRFRERCGDRTAEDPDTLGWWSFDSSDSPASFFAAYPKLAQTNDFCWLVAQTGATALPAGYSSDVTSAVVRAAGDYSQQFVNGGSVLLATNVCPSTYFEVKNDAAFVGGSFTEEFLFKTAHRVVRGGEFKNSYGVACSSYMKMLISKDHGMFFVRFKGSGGVMEDGSSDYLDDGLWHHVAVVHDASVDPPVSRCYLDKKLIKTSAFALCRDSTSHTIGFANDGSGNQIFDGWVDEYRVTRRALHPAEFMEFNANVSPDVIAQIACDGDFRLSPQQGISVTTGIFTKAGSVITTKLPYFVAPRAPELDSWKGVDDRFADAAAAKFEGGMVVWGDLPSLRRSNVTIEFFWKPGEYFAPWPVMLGMSDEYSGSKGQSDVANASVTGIPWAFYYNAAWYDATLSLCCDVTNAVAGTLTRITTSVSPTWRYSETHKDATDVPGWGKVTGCDHRWHHVAATIREYETGGVTNTEFVTYWDYKPVRTNVQGGRIVFKPGSVLQMNSHRQDKRYADWSIDHVRISKGILTPDQFVHTSRRGVVLFVR